MTQPKIILVTGEIESGKTSFCQKLAEIAKDSGYILTGLISPGVFQDGNKIAIDLLDLNSGDRRRLAELRNENDTGLDTNRWSFVPGTLQWGNRILEKVPPCDFLMIDEIGPLEFNRAQGLVAAFDLIDRGDFQAALLVVRPTLVHQASRRWKISRILDLSGSGPFPRSIDDFLNSLGIKSEAER